MLLLLLLVILVLIGFLVFIDYMTEKNIKIMNDQIISQQITLLDIVFSNTHTECTFKLYDAMGIIQEEIIPLRAISIKEAMSLDDVCKLNSRIIRVSFVIAYDPEQSIIYKQTNFRKREDVKYGTSDRTNEESNEETFR